jgi:hypothetical protein
LQRKKFFGILFVTLLVAMLLSVFGPVHATDYSLNLDTSPSEVLTLDPNALTGDGFYPSGTCVIIDAKPTVTSETVVYEFVEWSNYDSWPFDPDDEENPEPVLTETQAFIFMDGSRTVTAIYQPHYSFYLNLETSPSDVLVIEPNAVVGEGLYPSGTCVVIDALPSVTSAAVRYDFDEWSTHDFWTGDPDEEPVLTATQAFIFMDGSRTVTALYEEMFLGEWEEAYEDDSSGFKLRISTDDKYFQFVTPEKTFSIIKADSMIVRDHSTIISHSDDEIRLFSFSLNSNIDYCLVYARDMQTGQRYILIDRIGIE